MSAFLTCQDIAELTGRKVKSKQIEVLRKMGLPFWVNAVGKPVVPVAAIEGRKESPQNQKKTWTLKD
jgi:Domain of unknown function (DUF4224)